MIYKDIIDEMKRNNIKTDNISGDIEKTFKPFFKNENNLKRYSKDYLIQDYVNYTKNNFENLEGLILEAISFYRAALSANNEETLKAFAFFQDEMVSIGNKYWSMCVLQKDFALLEDDEYVMEAFNLIENISEILLKNFFSFMVYLNKIRTNKSLDFDSVKKIKFGNLYNELSQTKMLEQLFAVSKSDIPINQWRNIACHKDYQYTKGKVYCKYGENKGNQIILESKEELLDIAKNIYRISQAINYSFKFFTYDNIYEIYEYLDDSNNQGDIRDATWHLIFVTELYANGYEAIDIKEDDESVQAILKDMYDTKDIEKRAIQSSIALYKLWCLTGKDNLAVTYVTNNDKQCMKILCRGEICKTLSTGDKDISYLASNSTFIKLM
ncbi:hypothetical protein [[Clostridium] hylemonae]|uniref:hypothetical protein n=1 Tax=[Clostridium] hylemonae TaxID=89153 RepID=UPI001105E2FF|nr:hypothetical protein [[Clostridium] hylemonae]